MRMYVFVYRGRERWTRDMIWNKWHVNDTLKESNWHFKKFSDRELKSTFESELGQLKNCWNRTQLEMN